MPGPTVDELLVAGGPEPWGELGFDVDGDACDLGSLRVRFRPADPGRGIVGWSIRDAGSLDLDGIPTSTGGPPRGPAGPHPNGVVSVDHLVAMTPDLDRTVAALQAAAFDLRRVREDPTPGGAPRQAFFRMGDVILEVVQAPAGSRLAEDAQGPARLWGMAFLVDDLDATVSMLGERLGEPRAAVQPGRRIATLRRETGLGPAIAFMSAAGERRAPRDP